MMAFDLQNVLADILGSARALVDREVAAMEAAVRCLEKAERDRAMNRWPEGMRWRELADDNFVRLKTALDILDHGEMTTDAAGRRIVVIREGTEHVERDG